jgi:CheY-like chemotaxis protein
MNPTIEQGAFLVVEGSQPKTADMGELLKNVGLESEAADLEKALSLVQEKRFDGILVDSALPCNGILEVVSAVRATTKNEQTPIAILGSETDASLLQKTNRFGGVVFIVDRSKDRYLQRVMDLVRLAMMHLKNRWRSVPLTAGVACAVNGYCFSTPAAEVSETCLRVRRHPALVLGATAELAFRLPNGSCIFTSGMVSVHEGSNTVLQLDAASHVNRYLLQEFVLSTITEHEAVA